MKQRILITTLFVLLAYSMSYGQVPKDIDRSQKTAKKTEKSKSNQITKNSTNKNNQLKVAKKKTSGNTTYKRNDVFDISSKSAHFGANGGSTTFRINATGLWSITTQTASWGNLTRDGNSLTLSVNENHSNEARTDFFELSSGSRTIRVDISQDAGSTTLNVSSQNLNFGPDGGTQTINVSTNGSWSIGTETYSWGHLTRNGNQLQVKVDPYTGSSSRSDHFTVKAGNVERRIEINQLGQTTLSVSKQELSFPSSGSVQIIDVTSNDTWSISTPLANWGHAQKNGNKLSIRIDGNSSTSSRTDYMEIKAGNKIIRINVKQDGAYQSGSYPTSPSSSSYSSSSYYRKPFNRKKDDYVGGFSVGYFQKQWTVEEDGTKEKIGMFENNDYIHGIQAGIRIDPQFGWGIGMNSGVFYEYCWATSDDEHDSYGTYHYTYNEHGIYVPAHLKFTMNFSKWFQLSFYGGMGFNYVFSGKMALKDDYDTDYSEDVFEWDGMKKFNMMLEYGASIRINALQFDFTMSQGLSKWSDTDGQVIKQGRPMSVSATICF